VQQTGAELNAYEVSQVEDAFTKIEKMDVTLKPSRLRAPIRQSQS